MRIPIIHYNPLEQYRTVVTGNRKPDLSDNQDHAKNARLRTNRSPQSYYILFRIQTGGIELGFNYGYFIRGS